MYSETIRQHFMDPHNMGPLADADGVGQEGVAGQGNYIQIAVRRAAGRIEEVRFQSWGCPAIVAAGSVLTDLIMGRTAEEARRITVEMLEDALGLMPAAKRHCPEMAVRALEKALG